MSASKDSNDAPKKYLQEIKLASNQLVDKVREVIEEGNARRVVIKKEDRTLLEIPLTVGVGAGAAAVVLSPMLAAVGALAALVTDITLVIEHEEEPGTSDKTIGAQATPASGTPASKPVTDVEGAKEATDE